MWIENRMQQPKEKGSYKTLVLSDEFGTLIESKSDYFNGVEWSWTDSNAQFIRYWWSETRESLKELEQGLEDYYEDMQEVFNE